jgi:nitroreductase
MNDHADPADAVRPLLRTRQVREFTREPIAPAVLDALADVARWSGSSQNKQPWRFIVVTRPDTLRRLAESGLPSTRSLQTATAAIAIAMPEQPGRSVSSAYDEARAAERILVGASLLGIGAGIAWISGDGRGAVAEILGLPEDRFVRTIVAIGHPTEKAKEPKSERGEARLPREETVFRERWDG